MVARLTVLIALAAGLVACGDDEANNVGSKTPAQAVQAASDALGEVRSFRMDGYLVDRAEGRFEFDVDVVMPGRVRLAFAERGMRAEVIAIRDEGWMKASRGFWRENTNDQVADLLAGKWVRMPPASIRDFQYFLNIADPRLVGRCLVGTRLGTLVRGGSATVGGRDAVVVRDRGDKPGTAPGDIYIAATGRPLPLHMKQTGPERPGGTDDPVCSSSDDDDDSDSVAGELRFRDYDADIEIEPPKDALDLERLHEQIAPRSTA